MRGSLPDMLGRPGRATGAFTCYDLETAVAVLDAAAAAEAPVVLLIAPATLATASGESLLRSLVACADAAMSPALVQLDHADDLELMERALALGAGAVMADGSRQPLHANIELVTAAVELAGRYDAHVECELGHLAGDEDRARAVVAGALTDPADAAALIARSGASCLAVSIGNVHGHYATPPHLEFDRLQRIQRDVHVPLSLHGASGLDDDAVRHAIAGGIRKVNLNTELRDAYLTATSDALPRTLDDLDLASLHAAQRAAVREVVSRKLALFGVA